MRHNGFCLFALVVYPVVAGAQGLPGRDLFEFPLGSVAERGALSVRSGDGFRNPAGGSVRCGLLEGRAGLVRSSLAGHSATWPQTALGLHYARHFVAIAREEGREGLAPVYHFTLVSTFDRRP